jgi:hypothetical protein
VLIDKQIQVYDPLLGKNIACMFLLACNVVSAAFHILLNGFSIYMYCNKFVTDKNIRTTKVTESSINKKIPCRMTTRKVLLQLATLLDSIISR